VDLTALPEFRAFQANADRQRAQAEQSARQLQQQVDALQAQMNQRELASLDSLDPSEQVQILRRKLDQQAAQQAAAQAAAIAAQQRQSNIALVTQTLADLSLSQTDSEVAGILAAYGEPTAEAVAQINSRLGVLANQRLRTQQAQQLKEAQSAARVAQVQALDEAGVTATSAGNVASVVPGNERQRVIADFRTEWIRKRGASETPAYFSFMNRLRAAGLTLSDLQRS